MRSRKYNQLLRLNFGGFNEAAALTMDDNIDFVDKINAVRTLLIVAKLKLMLKLPHASTTHLPFTCPTGLPHSVRHPLRRLLKELWL